jgi:hypothetical protein
MTDQGDGASTAENLVALVRRPPTNLFGGWSQERRSPSVVAVPARTDHPQEPAQGPAYVSFCRQELQDILKVYGRMVAAGEWRDYAIDMLPDCAVFSVFRHASEVPLYRIEKTPKLARRQGAYSVVAQTGMILKRGPELTRVLHVFDKARLRVAE